MHEFKDIIEFWFEGLNDQQTIDTNSSAVKRWFKKDENFDNEIRENFEEDYKLAVEGKYKDWESAIYGRLALILLFDQLSRNMYRDTKRMFETDSHALKLTLKSIADKSDQELQLIERAFLYLPLMHSEDLEIQKMSMECFAQLVKDTKTKSPTNASYFKYTLDYAQKHLDIIEKFGRFPHRNVLLNRESTQEESEFLKTPGSSF